MNGGLEGKNKLFKASVRKENKHELAKFATHHYDELPHSIFTMNHRK